MTAILLERETNNKQLSADSLIDDILKNTPMNAPLTDDDILQEVKQK